MYSAYLASRVKDFVGKYGNDITDAIRGTGLYFSAVVAQKALESSYGSSELATKYNNFGGIKNYGSLSGAGVVQMDTTEHVGGKVVTKTQPFATYPNPKAAFESYVRILQDPNKKYTSAGVFSAPDAEEQILRIAKAGYTSTSPSTYLSSMKGIIQATRDLYGGGKIE